MRSITALTLTRPADTRALERGEDWRDRAVCRDKDPELFFPNHQDKAAVDRAKAVCASCPVREPCGKTALDDDERDGVWGGLDEKERETIRQRRNRYRGVAQ